MHIYQKIDALTYSDCSIHELLSFANEACALAYSLPSNKANDKFLSELKQTRDKEIKIILAEEDSLLRQEKLEQFEKAKKKLIQHLNLYLN